MDHFTFRDGKLFAEEVPVAEIAARFGTPTYVYCAATLRDHVGKLKAAFAPLSPRLCFAVKCCSNLGVLKVLSQAGCGMDVVSGGELYRALLVGVSPADIVYAGVGKTVPEIRMALGERAGMEVGRGVGREVERGIMRLPEGPISCFNIESEQELAAIAEQARLMGVRANAAVRVNPGVRAGGHEYITTAHDESKFGLPVVQAEALVKRFADDKHVRVRGLHMHIGSSITQPELYVTAVERMVAMIDRLAEAGVVIDSLDLGGGFAADYKTGDAPAPQRFAEAIVPLLAAKVAAGLKITIEPGRMVAANAGILLSRVLYTKQTGTRKFLIVDAGMHTLLRPALYEAFHFIWPASVSPQHEAKVRTEHPDLPGLEACDVVGPVCETGDFLAQQRLLPPVAPGELLAIFAAGAYGMSMASRYNSHPLPAEVLVDGETVEMVRRREVLGDLVEHELGGL